jgi:hypothetical protein
MAKCKYCGAETILFSGGCQSAQHARMTSTMGACQDTIGNARQHRRSSRNRTEKHPPRDQPNFYHPDTFNANTQVRGNQIRAHWWAELGQRIVDISRTAAIFICMKDVLPPARNRERHRNQDKPTGHGNF